jgi:hypothetical protein
LRLLVMMHIFQQVLCLLNFLATIILEFVGLEWL